MALKHFKPTSPGRRWLTSVDRSELYKGRPVKALTEGRSRKSGRNNHGHITVRRRGGGAKRLYRTVDFYRRRQESAVIERLEYDPFRTAFIALIRYEDGDQSYILAPQKITAGARIECGDKADILPGNALPLKSIPVGTLVHNVELKPGCGGCLARSAGTSVQLVGLEQGFAQLQLTSGEYRVVPENCMATIGVVSNPDHKNISLGKAGRSRWKGRRPKVLGVSMNPVDHPHGGGEGHTHGGRIPVTPWGVPTKGKRTRHNKRTQKYIIRRRKLKR